jgi:hypothetical protein
LSSGVLRHACYVQQLIVEGAIDAAVRFLE